MLSQCECALFLHTTHEKINISTLSYRFINHSNHLHKCEWASHGGPLDLEYHDNEWGVPVHSDRKLFEFLLLESAQAGLRWSIILRKREGYRRAFDNFDANKVANYDQGIVQQLLSNPTVVRNRLKIQSAVNNSRAFIKIKQEIGSFDSYLWNFVDGKPKQNEWKTCMEIPSRTEISDMLSTDLKKRGFVFVGSTICYSMMQAVGMVNDHTVHCFRHKILRLNHHWDKELNQSRYQDLSQSNSFYNSFSFIIVMHRIETLLNAFKQGRHITTQLLLTLYTDERSNC